MVLDQSTSIVTDDYDNWFVHMVGFATDIVQSFVIGPSNTQVGLMKFSDVIVVEFYLDEHVEKREVIDAISRLDITGGDTNIAGALELAREEMFSIDHGARSGAAKVLFLATDGTPNINGDRTLPEATATKNAGIEIFTIGITSAVNRDLLFKIASEPASEHLFFVEKFDELKNIVGSLVNISCGALPRSTAPTTHTTTTRSTRTTTTTTSTTTTTTPSPTTSTTTTTTTSVPTTTTTTRMKTTPSGNFIFTVTVLIKHDIKVHMHSTACIQSHVAQLRSPLLPAIG